LKHRFLSFVRLSGLIVVMYSTGLAISPNVQAETGFWDAITGGKLYFSARYRFEHVEDDRINPATGLKLKDRVGQELGREVVDVVSRITTSDSERPSVQLAIDTLHFADRTGVDKSYDAILTVLVLNGSIGFVGYPGEPFVEFQMELKRRAGIPAFFMGYTNGYLRYFPTIRASAEGGYGAAGAVVIVEVGAGERLLYRGLNLLYHMTGQLSAKPER